MCEKNYFEHSVLLFNINSECIWYTCCWWYPQRHWILLPNGSFSAGFLCLGHFSTLSSSLALSDPLGGRCPLSNRNFPWAKRRSLSLHCLLVHGKACLRRFSNLGALCGVKGEILPALTLCPRYFGLGQRASWCGKVVGSTNEVNFTTK